MTRNEIQSGLSKKNNESPFFLDSDECEPVYKNLRDNPNRSECKKFVESLWQIYQPYADKHFTSDACKHFVSRFWEMYLGATFIKRGFTIERGGGKGPEFYLSNTKKRIWVEAIAPGPGCGDDAVPLQNKPNVVYDTPIEQYILRLRHAIEEKHRKYKEYFDSSIVQPDDIYIIAINTNNISTAPLDSTLPSIVEAVYPFGNLTYKLNKNTLQIEDAFYEERKAIRKNNDSTVSTAVFLDPAYEGISAVIYSHIGCMHKPACGEDIVLVHNAVARNKLDFGTFQFGREYWWENGRLDCKGYEPSSNF